MIIRGVLEWKDYLKALRLHMQPRFWLRIAGYILLVAFIIIFALMLLGFHDDKSDLPIAVGVSFVFLYLFAWYTIYIPYKARKIFKQQKSLQIPFEVVVSKEGVHVSNEIGEAKIPWDNFQKWKENKNLFLIYHSDVLFQMLPKRLFGSIEKQASFRKTLTLNIQ